MKAFLLKVLIVKKSQRLRLFEKLTSETWGWIWETTTFLHISWKAICLGASEQTKVRGNYVCCLVIIWTWRSKEVGVFLNLSYGDKGKSHKQEELLWGAIKKTTQAVDHWTTLSWITYYFSLLWCKKVYALAT